jgi:hypothetical protein
MRFLYLLITILWLTSSNLNAQSNPIHQMDLNGICEKVYIHICTGIPFFKTSPSCQAIDPYSY